MNILCTRVVASSTEYKRIFGSERFLHQADFTTAALETVFVPMQIFVGHVFGVEANSTLADATGMRKVLLVARNATGMLIG